MTGLVRLTVLAGLVGGLAFAAPETTNTNNTVTPASSASTSVTSVAAPTDTKFIGVLDFRPSYTSRNGNLDTEDTIELGYQFNKNTKLSYAQFFKTDLFPANTLSGKGVHLRGDGGFLRMKVNNIWESENKATALSYQGRIYTPTDDTLAGTGFVAAVYNAVKLSHELGSLVKVDVQEVPMYWFFTQGGLGTSANPGYQNRLALNADFRFLPNLTLSIPLIVDSYRNRSFAGSANGDKWEHYVWIWPELDYDINSMHTIGLAYRSKNLVKADFTKGAVDTGLRDGVFQAVWTVNL